MTFGRFVFAGLPARVVFGRGAIAETAGELERLGARRILIATTAGRRAIADRIAEALGPRVLGFVDVTAPHVPLELAAPAREQARAAPADACLAVGGGSVIGLAKAIALTERVAIVAVPTTFSGSEMTPIWGITDRGVKNTGREPGVAPRTVVYDPDLFETLPPAFAVTSGLNALSHCVEATYAPDANPAITAFAIDGARRLIAALPGLAQPGPRSATDFEDAVAGAWLAGTCLAASTIGLHHKICHTLGGAFNLPHAETHAVILAHAIAYNREAAAAQLAPIAAALGATDAALGVYELAGRLGAPRSLAELGMPADGLERVADLAVMRAYPNPRPLERPAILQLLRDAYAGSPPR